MKLQRVIWFTFIATLALLSSSNIGQYEARFSVFTKLKDAVIGNQSSQNQTQNGTSNSNNSQQQQKPALISDKNDPRSSNNTSYTKSNANQAASDGQQLAKRSELYDAPFSYMGIDGDTRVPFWNIAHMVNSIDQIEPMLGNGSNGIEIDVSFDKRGVPVESYHGFPCDCGRHCHFREDFVSMVRYIARISVPPASSNLQLVLFDLKLKELDDEQKVVAGESLARILHEELYDKYARVAQRGGASSGQFTSERGQLERPPLRCVISINYVKDKPLIRSFLRYINQRKLDSMRVLVGFDVGMNDKLETISNMWRELDLKTNNIWQGDGLTNCLNLARETDRLREAVSMRNNRGYFRKVYFWTVDVLYQARSILRLGVDAVLTNQPQRIIQVLEEDEFRTRYRLATPYDDPFAQYWIQPSAGRMSLPNAMEARETIENLKNTSINWIKTIPEGIGAAVGKVFSSNKNKTI